MSRRDFSPFERGGDGQKMRIVPNAKPSMREQVGEEQEAGMPQKRKGRRPAQARQEEMRYEIWILQEPKL